jgi:hypothetical protein
MLRAELPLLCAYVQALSLSQWYATLVDGGGDTKEAFGRWESATRTAISLATKLGLAPSTRPDKKTVERFGEVPAGPMPWEA